MGRLGVELRVLGNQSALRVLMTKANIWGGRQETPCLFLYFPHEAPRNYGNLDSERLPT